MAVVLKRSWRTVVAIISVTLLLAGGIALLFPRSGAGHEGDDEPRTPIRIEHPENVAELNFVLGIKDNEKDIWEGELKLSTGRLLQFQIVHATRDSTINGAAFKAKDVKTKKTANNAQKNTTQQTTDTKISDSKNTDKKAADQKKSSDTPTSQNKSDQPQQKNDATKTVEEVVFTPVRLRALIDAPPTATVTMATSRGEFSFTVGDLKSGMEKSFLDGQVSVRREPGAMPLTGRGTEDDFPVATRDKSGAIWLAYVEYHPGPELVNERVLAGNFDLLLPTDHGDQIRLMKFDGKVWHPVPPPTEKRLDIWRPTIAIDGAGGVWVAWAQKLQDDWNIFARRYVPAGNDGAEGVWGDTIQITAAPGSDFHVVAASDSKGKIWLAWQGWRGDNYDILLAAQKNSTTWDKPKTISKSPRDDWSPSIAADGQGRVFVAWDTYDRDNFDVMLHTEDPKGTADPRGTAAGPVAIADSARFEARANLFCDTHNRLWAAYEEGDEQWGKDYASDDGFTKVGLERNPGYALYVHRTVRLKCLDGTTWKEPSARLQDAFGDELARNKSLPRLMGDSSEGLWLLFRHHPLSSGAGEVWQTYAMRCSGAGWSVPHSVPGTMNLLDNRPVVQPFGDGLLVVASSDTRTKTADRGQDDLYMSLLSDTRWATSPDLVAVAPNPPTELQPVHKNEREMVDLLRKFRVTMNGQELRIVRGEFHRHTEYSAHRDQDGLLEDSWRYSLDAGKLDWMGNGDHDNGGGDEYMWWTDQKQCDLHHNPPYFVAAMTYERSVVFPNGHRNVMMPVRGIRPLPRGETKGTAEAGTPDTKILYSYLKHFGGICSSHTSGTNMGTDWRDNDPEVEPVVEVYQGHRHNYEHFGAPRSATEQTNIGGYQPSGFIWNALEKGYKLGFQSSSDHVSTHMSYACVYAADNSRQAIIDGFKQRHSYGATDNIFLLVQSGTHMMGDIFTSKQVPLVQIRVRGGDTIAKVSIVRDSKYVYSSEPGTIEFNAEYRDAEAKPGEPHYYYVRVQQSDGNLAWGSPMWITFQP